MTRPDDARWVHDVQDHAKPHLARPRSPLTLCGVLVGELWGFEPARHEKTNCGCIITDLVERGEVRFITRTRTMLPADL